MSPSPPTPPPAAPPDHGTWPRSAQLTTAFLLGVVITLLTVHVLSYQRISTRPAELERPYRVDLNRASRAELMQLPGVGEATVARLEDYRRDHDGFRSVDELTQVHGIGPATLERLRPLVYVRDEPEEEGPPPPVKTSSGKRKTGKKEANLKEPIDLNRATATDLQRLPGVGVKTAQRILDERQKKPFKSVDDLRRVSGIGPKTLERLRPYVVAQSSTELVAEEP